MPVEDAAEPIGDVAVPAADAAGSVGDVAVPAADAAGSAEGADDAGCACDAARSSGGAPLAWLVLIAFGLARRRRR